MHLVTHVTECLVQSTRNLFPPRGGHPVVFAILHADVHQTQVTIYQRARGLVLSLEVDCPPRGLHVPVNDRETALPVADLAGCVASMHVALLLWLAS